MPTIQVLTSWYGFNIKSYLFFYLQVVEIKKKKMKTEFEDGFSRVRIPVEGGEEVEVGTDHLHPFNLIHTVSTRCRDCTSFLIQTLYTAPHNVVPLLSSMFFVLLLFFSGFGFYFVLGFNNLKVLSHWNYCINQIISETGLSKNCLTIYCCPFCLVILQPTCVTQKHPVKKSVMSEYLYAFINTDRVNSANLPD